MQDRSSVFRDDLVYTILVCGGGTWRDGVGGSELELSDTIADGPGREILLWYIRSCCVLRFRGGAEGPRLECTRCRIRGRARLIVAGGVQENRLPFVSCEPPDGMNAADVREASGL
jgi:hypothetical protein